MSTSTAHTCVSRRAIVGTGIAGVGAVCLAACSSGSDSDDSGADDTDTGAEDQDTGEQDDAGQDGGGDGVLAALDDIEVGGALSVQIDGEPALLTRPSEDEVLAFSGVCTHEGCEGQPGEGDLVCPCHNSVFDMTNGEVLDGPADSALPSYDVDVVDGNVVLA